YPPITFMPRVALKATRIGTYKVRKGALLMISPWTLHRHTRYWTDPDRFDPERFMPEREKEVLPGTYIPFGSGPHTCVGAGFAAIESALILGRLTRAFDFLPVGTGDVKPAARLTTRPSQEIQVRVRNRSHGHSRV
ncbi:MAG: cytochrome P450, partial [Pseudomonadota bacterium]